MIYFYQRHSVGCFVRARSRCSSPARGLQVADSRSSVGVFRWLRFGLLGVPHCRSCNGRTVHHAPQRRISSAFDPSVMTMGQWHDEHACRAGIRGPAMTRRSDIVTGTQTLACDVSSFEPATEQVVKSASPVRRSLALADPRFILCSVD